MTEEPQAAASTIASVLDQMATMRAESVTFEPRGPAGSVAHVRVAGGTHEILCELNAEGDLLSARVIEL